MNFDGVVFFR